MDFIKVVIFKVKQLSLFELKLILYLLLNSIPGLIRVPTCL